MVNDNFDRYQQDDQPVDDEKQKTEKDQEQELEDAETEQDNGENVDSLEQELAQLTKEWEQERTNLVNQLLRLKADFDNYKRRQEALVESIKNTANENLMLELLPVMDNFARAINSETEDDAYASGVKMIFKQIFDCLCKQGLKPIDAVGYPFDPNLHEAVSMEGDADQNLVVVTELQKGYLFKDKLLRASMVQVAPEKLEEE